MEGENSMKTAWVFPILIVFAVSGMTQSAPPGSALSSPAKSVGLFAYPKNQQNADQQLKDETECYGSAKQQTGTDPQAPPRQHPALRNRKPPRSKLQSKLRDPRPREGP